MWLRCFSLWGWHFGAIQEFQIHRGFQVGDLESGGGRGGVLGLQRGFDTYGFLYLPDSGE